MKKLKVTPGDIVQIPVSADEFIVCRVISEERVSAHLVEFFARKYANTNKHVNLADLGPRLFRPIFVNFLFFTIPKWKVLQKDTAYTPEQSGYAEIKIAFAGGAPPELWQGGVSRPVVRELLAGLEESIAWIPDKLIQRIHDHLAGKFGPEEVYPV